MYTGNNLNGLLQKETSLQMYVWCQWDEYAKLYCRNLCGTLYHYYTAIHNTLCHSVRPIDLKMMLFVVTVALLAARWVYLSIHRILPKTYLYTITMQHIFRFHIITCI